MAGTLGLDISAKRLLAVVRDPGGEIQHQARYRMDRYLKPRPCAMLLMRAIADARNTVGTVNAIGIGFPGPVYSSQGIARASAVRPGWENVRLGPTIRTPSGLPCAVDNRTNNIARAELSLRSPKPNSFLFVNAGPEISASVVLNGALWMGATGLAGEIGHICIDPDGDICSCGLRGCAQTVASLNAVGQTLGVNPTHVSVCMQTRPEACEQALGDAGKALGSAIATALNLLNMNLVILGGPLTGFSTYRTAVELTTRNQSLDLTQAACSFEIAQTGTAGKGIGAALLGLELVAMRTNENQTAA